MRNVSEHPSSAIVDHIPIVGVLMLLLLPVLVCVCVCVCVLRVPMLVVCLLAINDRRCWCDCAGDADAGVLCVVVYGVCACVCVSLCWRSMNAD